ncbi:MAG TPA: agmatinase [Hyphomicrobiaceae bacterium]|nr:agmatinase [Hyphomicrobiaceae bacterium]
MSAKLEYLSAAESFLDPVRADADQPASARAVIVPFGLEASVSYGTGTAAGPAAILKASQQLELYDDELGREAYLDYGVAALREPAIAMPIAAALEQVQGLVEAVVAAGKFPLVLGGEHSLTAGAIRPLLARHADLVVLQFDAHADLRDGYLGEPYSHAAAMRRVLDHAGVSLIQVGLRSVAAAEAAYMAQHRDRISVYWAKDQAAWDIDGLVRQLGGRPLYVSFDIDALDAAVMPATGTPTPGGLGYWQALALLRRACAAGRVVGADLVEFAPIASLHAYDYTAAALAYKLLNYALCGAERPG